MKLGGVVLRSAAGRRVAVWAAGLFVLVGHLCTPWAWRRRRTVVAAIAVVGSAWIVRLADLARHRQYLGLLVYAVISGPIYVWPAVRCIRRWDIAHRDPEEPRIRRW